MRFRRRSETGNDPGEPTPDDTAGLVDAAPPVTAGPRDAATVDLEDGVERVDLGSLLIAGSTGRDLRIQVDEKSGNVQSVLLAGPDGAVDVRAFAAPRDGDLWDEIRREIAAETSRRGGTATEQEGRFGTELMCLMSVTAEDGRNLTQPSRVVGINGPRWMLRATFLGRPAVDPATAAEWDEALGAVVVRRGTEAMPPGDPLALTLPPNASRVE